DALLDDVSPDPALPRRPRRRVRQLEIGLMTTAAETDDVVCPGAAEGIDDVIRVGGYVPFDIAGEGPHAPGRPGHRAAQTNEADGGMRRLFVAAADDGHLVAACGEMGGDLIHVAFRAAAMAVPQVDEG